jgi:hypothetical protein
MDDQISSRDPDTEPVPGAEHLHPVPVSHPAAPPQKKLPGPKTPQGKARSSRNAMRFGIHSPAPLIPGESAEEWDKHRAGMLASLERANYLETFLADRMVLASWSLKRVTAYEVAEFTRANKGSKVFRLPPANELDNIQRYEARLTRQFYQSKHELEVLQKQRRGEATPLARLDVQGAPEQAELAPEAEVYELKTITPLNP